MGVYNSADISQENIQELLERFDMVREYIDYVLVLTKNNIKEHLKELEKVLQIIKEVVLKVNA